MMRTRDEVKTAAEAAIRKDFPTDTVDVSDGYANNIHVVVVSRRFDDMEDSEAADYLWQLLEDGGLQQEELGLISLVLPTSPALLK